MVKDTEIACLVVFYEQGNNLTLLLVLCIFGSLAKVLYYMLDYIGILTSNAPYILTD